MDNSVVDFAKVLKTKKKISEEVEKLEKRRAELKTQQFWIEKELQLIDYLILSATDRTKFDMEVLSKHLKEFDEE